MATSELKIIDIKSKFDVCEFPIKNSFVALDTSALMKVYSPSKEEKNFINCLVQNNNYLVIPYKAIEELRIFFDREPPRKPIIVTEKDRLSSYTDGQAQASIIITSINKIGIVHDEYIDILTQPKAKYLDNLGLSYPLRWPDLTILGAVLDHEIPYLWTYDSDFGIVPREKITLITNHDTMIKIQNNGIPCNKIINVKKGPI